MIRGMKLLATVLIPTSLFAQSNTVGSGGEGSSASGSINYSIGQVTNYIYSGSGAIILEGLQQPVDVGTLPVHLLFFTAALSNKTVLLSWSTVNEFNNDFFLVERSADGIHFNSLQQVAGKGNQVAVQTYQSVDEHPLNGKNYYRLKQTDKDGHFSYSPIVPVTLAQSIEVNVYPNPVTQYLSLSVKQDSTSTLTYRLADVNGKMIRQEKIISSTTVISLADVSSGIYFLLIERSNEIIQTIKIKKD